MLIPISSPISRVGVSLHVVQHEDLFRPFRQALDRGFEIHGHPGVPLPGREPIQESVRGQMSLPPPPQGLTPGEDQVHSQTVKPGPE